MGLIEHLRGLPCRYCHSWTEMTFKKQFYCVLILYVCTCPWHSRGIRGTHSPSTMWALGVRFYGLTWQQMRLPTEGASFCSRSDDRSDDILSGLFKTCFRVLLGGADREGRLRSFWEALSRAFVPLVTLCDKRVLYYTVSFSCLYSWAAPVTSPRDLWAFPESSSTADTSEHISCS